MVPLYDRILFDMRLNENEYFILKNSDYKKKKKKKLRKENPIFVPLSIWKESFVESHPKLEFISFSHSSKKKKRKKKISVLCAQKQVPSSKALIFVENFSFCRPVGHSVHFKDFLFSVDSLLPFEERFRRRRRRNKKKTKLRQFTFVLHIFLSICPHTHTYTYTFPKLKNP